MTNFNIDKNKSSIDIIRFVNDDRGENLHKGKRDSERNEIMPADDVTNPNIPLQRIFVSVNPGAPGISVNILKEGWMINCNENNDQVCSVVVVASSLKLTSI